MDEYEEIFKDCVSKVRIVDKNDVSHNLIVHGGNVFGKALREVFGIDYDRPEYNCVRFKRGWNIFRENEDGSIDHICYLYSKNIKGKAYHIGMGE